MPSKIETYKGRMSQQSSVRTFQENYTYLQSGGGEKTFLKPLIN